MFLVQGYSKTTISCSCRQMVQFLLYFIVQRCIINPFHTELNLATEKANKPNCTESLPSDLCYLYSPTASGYLCTHIPNTFSTNCKWSKLLTLRLSFCLLLRNESLVLTSGKKPGIALLWQQRYEGGNRGIEPQQGRKEWETTFWRHS